MQQLPVVVSNISDISVQVDPANKNEWPFNQLITGLSCRFDFSPE
jgi:hypothetical protein